MSNKRSACALGSLQIISLSMKHCNDNLVFALQKNHTHRQLINQVVSSIPKECLLLWGKTKTTAKL